MPIGLPFQLACALLPALALGGCISEDPVPERNAIEWNRVETPVGAINVALVRPADEGTRAHPVIVALPWGSGSADLVQAFVSRYWREVPASRGYYVVSPEVLGSSLETTAGDIIPALFDWMESELTIDVDNVALVGASNGGRGLFFAAVANPERFGALLAMPGMYLRDPQNLAALDGIPIRMIVGERDTQWVDGTRRTATALESVGVEVQVDIADNQDHVLDLDANGLMDWIEQALSRSALTPGR